MYDAHIDDIPAAARLVDDVLQRLLSHARVMLERQLAYRIALVHIAHQAHERGERTDRTIPAHSRQLGTDVEVLLLDTNIHLSSGHRRKERNFVAGMDRL